MTAVSRVRIPTIATKAAGNGGEYFLRNVVCITGGGEERVGGGGGTKVRKWTELKPRH